MHILADIPPQIVDAIDSLRASSIARARRRVELQAQKGKILQRLRTLPVEALRRIHDEARKGHLHAERATERERAAHRKQVLEELQEVERQLTLVAEKQVSRRAMINKLLAEALTARGVVLPEE